MWYHSFKVIVIERRLEMKKITGFLLAVAFVFAVGFISADNTYAAGDKDNGIKVKIGRAHV